jgi:adenylate cyclase class 2
MHGPIETEIKLPVPGGAEEALRRIEQQGYRLQHPRTLQVDQLFDLPGGTLRQSGRVLRVRSEGDSCRLTYKGPPLPSHLHKSREELEASVQGSGTLLAILDRLGYVPSFRYEKFRTTFTVEAEPGIITLDETPIGVFLELEGPEDWIDSTASRLGFSTKDYVTASYAALYGEYRARNGGTPDMTF